MHERLQTGVALKKKKWKREANCNLCNCPETVDHILFQCILAKFVWACLKEILGWDQVPQNLFHMLDHWILWGALSMIWNSLLSWLWPGLYGCLEIRSDYNSSSRDLQLQSCSNLPPLCSDGRCSYGKLIKGSWRPKLVRCTPGRRLLRNREVVRRMMSGVKRLFSVCDPRTCPVAVSLHCGY